MYRRHKKEIEVSTRIGAFRERCLWLGSGFIIILTAVYPMESFVLILEFNQNEYRVLDMKQFLKEDTGLLAEIGDSVEMFMTAKINTISGVVSWSNGADFDLTSLLARSLGSEF